MAAVDYARQIVEYCQLLDDALGYLRRQTVECAAAENAYRKERARAWLTATGTAREKEDQVNAMTADLRETRDLAEGMKKAALEAVRSRRAEISAHQTLLSADRAEAELAKYGPRSVA